MVYKKPYSENRNLVTDCRRVCRSADESGRPLPLAQLHRHGTAAPAVAGVVLRLRSLLGLASALRLLDRPPTAPPEPRGASGLGVSAVT